MASSSRYGIRGSSPSNQGTDSVPTMPTHAGGQRGVPATYGGRHHMGSHGPASLSEMTPGRPQGMDAAAKQYGGRHHYGAQIRSDIEQEASSPENVADQVATEMFGLVGDEDDAALFREIDALLSGD